MVESVQSMHNSDLLIFILCGHFNILENYIISQYVLRTILCKREHCFASQCYTVHVYKELYIQGTVHTMRTTLDYRVHNSSIVIGCQDYCALY